jgi:hypothetical protein
VPHHLPHVGSIGSALCLDAGVPEVRTAGRLTRWRLTGVGLVLLDHLRWTEFVYFGLDGHEIGHERGSGRASHVHV